MCLAASAAAARLSVEAVGDRHVAVDARVEGDDGDVVVLGLLHQRSGAWLSMAAKPTACGLLVEDGLQQLELLLDVALLLGTFEGDRTPNSVPACSAPAFTACQNWCRNPFEMSAT